MPGRNMDRCGQAIPERIGTRRVKWQSSQKRSLIRNTVRVATADCLTESLSRSTGGEVKRFGGGRPGSLGIALICSDCRDDHGLRRFEDVGRLNEYFLSLEEEG